MDRFTKLIASPASTGGLGVHFENRVQASFVVLMLANGFAPGLPSLPIAKIQLQARRFGFHTDDIVVFVEDIGSRRHSKLLGQIKSSLRIISSDEAFSKTILDAWNDFNNKELFNIETDVIALICGPLSATDTYDVRALLQKARYSNSTDDFIMQVEAYSTGEGQRKKLDVFKSVLKKANDDEDLTDEQLWLFLKSFRLLIYDLDIEGVVMSLSKTIIGQQSDNDVNAIWAQIYEFVGWKSVNDGSISRDSIPEEILSKFIKKQVVSIPKNLVAEYDDRDWNKYRYDQDLAYMALLGGWNDKSESDIEIVREFTGENYNNWMRNIRDILQLEESPISLINGVWKMENHAHMWQVLAARIHDNMLDSFVKCAITVLTERDPKFTLSKEDRFAANIYGKALNHSHSLRSGLAHSLAFIGCFPEKLIKCSQNKAENVVSHCMREIFKNDDWELWASLSDQLPILAEASPKDFLATVETELRSDENAFLQLFEQESSGLTGSNYLTGLLWALEALAWDEQLLVRVTVILGELASLDPGGNWINRPINSLSTIFLPWYHQTLASPRKRKVAVEMLIKESPEISWKLLIGLLPRNNQITTPTNKPQYRNPVSEDWKPADLNANYWEEVAIYADYAVELAKGDISKLSELIDNLDNLPEKARSKTLEYLLSYNADILEEDRVLIWTKLKSFIRKHERFADSGRVLDSSELSSVKNAEKGLRPNSPINRYRYLFNENDMELYEDTGDWRAQEKLLEERRQSALLEIICFGGIDAVLQFIGKVKSPYKAGVAFGTIGDSSFDKFVFPEMFDTEDESLNQFINAYINSKHTYCGWAWIDELDINDWSNKLQLGFFLCLPATIETWERIDDSFSAIHEQYWESVNIHAILLELPELEKAIYELISVGRPLAAVSCFYGCIFRNEPFDAKKLADVLIQGITTSESVESINSHHIIEAIKYLQNSDAASFVQMVNIEWGYFQFLDKYNGASRKTLEKALAVDPDFFSDIIGLIYRPKNVGADVDAGSEADNADDKRVLEAKKIAATKAFTLLNEWKRVPGFDNAGQFDSQLFLKWFESVQKKCLESGRLDAAMRHIGEVLFYSPNDPGGFWINKTIAESLNNKDAEKMRRGYRLRACNSRGVYTVDPARKAEKKLADKYKELAEETENAGYHRFATTLRSVAATYDSETTDAVS